MLEYTDGGDLFHTSEQLNSSEVRSIMGQLLLASQFLHSCGVIHRDIKSANILIKTNQETGEKTVKLADFGCARVASTNGDGAKGMTRSRSHDSLPEQKSPEGSADLRRAQMTTAVATPCYRAPEVVMSLESYTSKVDIWSLGCILAELLARVLSHSKGERPAGHLDPASILEHELRPDVRTSLPALPSPYIILSPFFAFSARVGYCKHLRVFPLFNLTSQPRVFSGVSWDDGDGATMAHRELRTVFEVIGTPAWRHVDNISDEKWRKFLSCLPGHAPTLSRRFQGIPEVCMDLLRRMLEFDPDTRCGAAEALSHEFFREGVEEGEGEDRKNETANWGEVNAVASHTGRDREAFDRLETELEQLLRDEDDTQSLKLKRILQLEIEEHRETCGAESWKPVEIRSPRRASLNLGKSAAVLSSYPYDNTAQKNMVGEDANQEMTKSYHGKSHGQETPPRKKNSLFLDCDRHKDWASGTLVESHWMREKAGEPVWGVTKKIPGMEDEESNKIVSEQQSR